MLVRILICLLLISASAADSGTFRCNCDDEGSTWSVESILECQRVSDFLIAVAYFSIPIELLYFVSCSNVPFKWVLFQFIAFIVLCGLTHLLNGWTYGPHTFQVMVALTVFKVLTALVSCATAITLLTLFPLLLKLKVREFMLKKKTWDLDREVGSLIKQKETGLTLPDYVMGDEKRVFQMILHIVGNLLNSNNEGGTVMLRVFPDRGSQERHNQRWAGGTWRQSSSCEDVFIRFEIGINDDGTTSQSDILTHHAGSRYNSDGLEQHLSFTICKKLAQMMQGNISVIPNARGLTQSMTLALRFQLRPSISIAISESGESSEYPHSNSIFRGLHVVLADHDDLNRAVTKKLLERLGCTVNAYASGFECLTALGPAASSYQIILLDLQMPELDGFEVATRIRKFRSRSWPLIVALTASGGDDVWEKCKQIGMNGIIRKPVQLQGIANELRRVLVQANKVV
ncbi:hypothetical protein ACFE04_014792 [Oxalis oulophora]